MNTITSELHAEEALAQSALAHLKSVLRHQNNIEVRGSITEPIEQAHAHLIDALKRVPGSAGMGVEPTSQILLHIGQELEAGKKIDRMALDNMIQNAMGQTQKETGVFTKLAHAAAENKLGKLLVKHPGEATGVAALATLMAAYIWPNQQKSTPQPDGMVDRQRQWSGMKKATVGLGAVLTAGLLAHYAHSAWTGKLAKETAVTLSHSI